MNSEKTVPLDPDVTQSGMLDVGNGHSIYWEDWGNPQAPAIMHFHGGPGAGFSSSHKLLFDPQKHRVIFFDQRGAGRSTPFAETRHNTTQLLVADTEKLRMHLGIEQMYLVGGSWGSTMTLMYALTYPKRVRAMVAWGIYLGSKFENDLISGGYARYNYPEAWERFINSVPEELRGDGTAVTQFYADKINSDDISEATTYADEWTLWEASLLSLSYDKRKLEQDIIGSPINMPIAKLETTYFLNNCFIPENYIIDNLNIINHIPIYVVQGRFDNCTPPVTAHRLAQAYGVNMTLQMVNSGHRRSDSELQVSLRAVVSTLFI